MINEYITLLQPQGYKRYFKENLAHTASVPDSLVNCVLRFNIFPRSILRVSLPGLDNATTLERVRADYRMPCPAGPNIDCPPKLYDMMRRCWDKAPDLRPTFAYLRVFFDDYATETEGQYQPPV